MFRSSAIRRGSPVLGIRMLASSDSSLTTIVVVQQFLDAGVLQFLAPLVAFPGSNAVSARALRLHSVPSSIVVVFRGVFRGAFLCDVLPV
jgi:hypothetical protein